MFLFYVFLASLAWFGCGIICWRIRPHKISAFWVGLLFGCFGILIIAILNVSDKIERTNATDKDIFDHKYNNNKLKTKTHICIYSTIFFVIWLLIPLMAVASYHHEKSIEHDKYQRHLEAQQQLEQDRKRREELRLAELKEREEQRRQNEHTLRLQQEREEEELRHEREQREIRRRAFVAQQQKEREQQAREQQERIRIENERQVNLRKEQQERIRIENIRNDTIIIEEIQGSTLELITQLNEIQTPASRHHEALVAIRNELNVLSASTSRLSKDSIDVFRTSHVNTELQETIERTNTMLAEAKEKRDRWNRYNIANANARRQEIQEQEVRRREYIARREREKAERRQRDEQRRQNELNNRVIINLGATK
jgi:hypothetical protein